MKQYLNLADYILRFGNKRGDRTGTGTISSFGHRLEFNMEDGFPAITTKKLFIRGVWVELLWMLSGNTSGRFMLENNVHIWDEWMDDDNNLGRVYGVQWRRWRGRIAHFENGEYPVREYIDQLQGAIDSIRDTPTNRRMLVTAWRPDELDEMALPPCHLLYQFYVDGDKLDIQVYQRSADVFLGLPFDIASYATLLHMVAHVTGKTPGRLIYLLGDTHIYTNHIDQVLEQLKRMPFDLPKLNVNARNREIKTIDDFQLEDLHLVDYNSHGPLKGKVSI
jgi:thymidylate synthase